MSEKIEIYGQRLSPYVERLYLQVKIKELSGKVEFPGIPGDDLKSREYLAINPLGKMPALKWENFHLFESAVIAEFLEDQFPDKPLLPSDPKKRAQVRLILQLLDVYFHPATGRLLGQILAERKDQEVIDKNLGKLRETLVLLETLMTGTDRIFGADYTLADAALFSSFYFGVKFFPDFGADFFADCSKLKNWYECLEQEKLFRESNKVRAKELVDFMKRMKSKSKS